MRRLFSVVPSSSDVQYLHRLSFPLIIIERCIATGEVRCEKFHQRTISNLQISVILYRYLPERLILWRFTLLYAFFHCASSWILYKIEDGDASLDHRVNFC